MINDGQQTTKELQDKIFLAAERARGSYSATADTVAKLGTLAGSAFSSNDEIIAFAEQMNKQFVIGGASVQEQTSAMYQLTQAMAAGKLQGDEFRSIMENAPLLAQSIADRMGKTTGELKEMSSQGLITADIIKSSLFAAADETNAKFEQMPMTFGQIWTSISNQALLAFQPFLDKLNEIANSPAFQSLVDGVISAVQMLGSIAIPILNAILAVGRAIYNFIAANIQPIMIVLITLLVIFGAQAIAAGISAFVSFLMATWPLLLIIAIVALVILAINKLGVSFEVIFAKIGEIVGVAIASIVNIFIDLWNFLAGFVNMFARIFDDPVAGIIGLFVEMFTFILNILSRVAKVIDTIFGTGISDAISGFGDRVTGWYNDTFGPTEEFVAKMEPIDADEWGAKGANIGGGIGAFMDNPDMGSLFPSNIPNASDYGTGFDFSGIESGVGNIDANTKQSADFSEEELKLWRDIAERDVVNSFTTAEVTVDFGGITNNVASEIDLDGIIDYLADGIEETLFEVAEGVHA
jgi:tape measure domain-containing protein